MHPTGDKALEILKTIKHPETGNDIVSMGMVQDLKADDASVGFTLALQKPNDPLPRPSKVCARSCRLRWEAVSP